MKVLLLVGDSGVGKTTIAKELCKNDKYNYIASYTDREKRFDKEWGHVFVTKDFMSEILAKDDIVASTKIGDTNYCALKSQFMNDVINVYIVDEEGMNKTIKNLPDADIVTILVTKEDVDVHKERRNRNVNVPTKNIDFTIHNDYHISTAVGTINVLLNTTNSFNKKNSEETIEQAVKELYDKSDAIDRIINNLNIQKWERDKPIYDEMIYYINGKLEKNKKYKELMGKECLVYMQNTPKEAFMNEYAYSIYPTTKIDERQKEILYNFVEYYAAEYRINKGLVFDARVHWEFV